MKILMLSNRGDGLGIANKLAQHDHEVVMSIKAPQFANTGVGLINRVDSWRPYFKDADLIVCDYPGAGSNEDLFKRSGKDVLCCNKIIDIMSLDSGKAYEYLNKIGVGTPKTWTVDNSGDGSAVMAQWPDSGVNVTIHLQGGSTETTKCPDKETFYWLLSKNTSVDNITIQENVGGEHVTISAFFDGTALNKPFFYTYKSNFEYGPAGVVVQTSYNRDKLGDTLHRVIPLFKKANYRGMVSADCIVTPNTVTVSSLRGGLDYDTIEAVFEGLKDEPASLLNRFANGVAGTVDMIRDYLIVVRVYHASDPASYEGMPINGLVDDNLKHIFLHSVYKDEETYRFSAADTLVMKVAAVGRDIKEAKNRAYRTIKNINILNKNYCDEVGLTAEKTMKRLRDYGYVQ